MKTPITLLRRFSASSPINFTEASNSSAFRASWLQRCCQRAVWAKHSNLPENGESFAKKTRQIPLAECGVWDLGQQGKRGHKQARIISSYASLGEEAESK